MLMYFSKKKSQVKLSQEKTQERIEILLLMKRYIYSQST